MLKEIPYLVYVSGFFGEFAYPCLCLCLGLEQITIIRPRLRISRHFSQILRTEALIFILVIPCFKSKSICWKQISFLEVVYILHHILTKGMFKLKNGLILRILIVS